MIIRTKRRAKSYTVKSGVLRGAIYTDCNASLIDGVSSMGYKLVVTGMCSRNDDYNCMFIGVYDRKLYYRGYW